MELWGDRIESIRFFDILDQRSITRVETVRVLPVSFPSASASSDDAISEAAPSISSLLEILPMKKFASPTKCITKGDTGLPKISSGLPIWMIFPFLRTTILSAIVIASS
ncbi:MAG: hypothetical protein ACE5IO_09480 [Thermoplasmata archaeon]